MAKQRTLRVERKRDAAPARKASGNGAALSVVRVGRSRKSAQTREDLVKTIEKKNREKKSKSARIREWMRENLPPPGTPEWEALCTHCGKCCYDKVWSGNRLLLLTSPCSFLDTGAERCTCYDERFEREPLCMPIDHEIILMGGLPEDCPYVAELPGYKGPIPVDKTIDEC